MTDQPLVAFAEKLRSGKPQFLGWVGMAEPMVAGVLARAGFDAVLLDQQHGYVDTKGALAGIGEVALAGKPCFVRHAVGDFAFASRALDFGACGVVAPMINSVADAKTFASYMKFPPMGDRSWGPARALQLSGLDMPSYLKRANSFSLAIAMVETRAAMAVLDGILDVEGIDGVLVGPSDTSITYSNGARIDPYHADVNEVLDTVVSRCKARKKLACVFSPTADRAREMAAKGFNLISVANDTLLLRAAAEAALKTARG